MGSPARSLAQRQAPSRMRYSPSAPASTTPVRRSTASSSGVRATDARAASTSLPRKVGSAPSAFRAAWATSVITVRMVPGTGRATALKARSLPAARPRASSSTPRVAEPRAASARPLQNWERIRPLLPRAPASAPRAKASATRQASAAGSRSASPRP